MTWQRNDGKPHLEKCWELPDWVFVMAIQTVCAIKNLSDTMPAGRWTTASRWDIAAVLAGHPEHIIQQVIQEYPGVPPKLVLAKARQMIDKGTITGCACGCRGDFEVVNK